MPAALPLSEHVVLITGAGRGLGSTLARAAAREGARVVVNYRRSADAAVALAAEFGDRALAVEADVTDPDAVQAMIDTATTHFGAPITSVVNNALPDYSFNGDARSTADTITTAALLSLIHI